VLANNLAYLLFFPRARERKAGEGKKRAKLSETDNPHERFL